MTGVQLGGSLAGNDSSDGLVDDVSAIRRPGSAGPSDCCGVPHLGESSLFSAAARSLSAVSTEGDHAEVESQPATAERSMPCRRRQQPRSNRSDLGGQTGRERVNRRGQLCGKRKCDFGSTVFARREDFLRRAIGIHRHEWQSAANAKPGVLGPVIAFELTVSWTAGPHQSRANGRHINPIFDQFSPHAFGQSNQGELAGTIGRKMGHSDFSADGGDVHDAALPAAAHLRKHLLMHRNGAQKWVAIASCTSSAVIVSNGPT